MGFSPHSYQVPRLSAVLLSITLPEGVGETLDLLDGPASSEKLDASPSDSHLSVETGFSFKMNWTNN